jgi:glycerophosphoryl diester phosphodiesterase
MIELDVIKTRSGRVLIAHDYSDVSRRRPLRLAEGMDLFTRPPLDAVRIDWDLKVPAGEEELAAGLRERGLIERSMVSTPHLQSIGKMHSLDPDLRLGWSFPRVRRDWATTRWAAPGVAATIVYLRQRLPKILARKVRAGLPISEIWPYFRLVTPGLVEAARALGLVTIAWTVDDLNAMRRIRDMGVDGICTNDPRLFAEL